MRERDLANIVADWESMMYDMYYREHEYPDEENNDWDNEDEDDG